MEGVGEVLGVLHQLVGISDVCQAEPEDGPHPINEAAITMFKVPGQRETEHVSQSAVYFKLMLYNTEGPISAQSSRS